MAEIIRQLLVEKKFKINAYDIDAMGIVSNIVYIRWFEDLRMLFLDTYWPLEIMLRSGKSPVLAKTEIEYKHPLTIFDKPNGCAWASNLGRSKWEMEFEFINGNKVICTGKQTGYVIDLKSKKPVEMPDELRKKYRESQKKGNNNVTGR